MNPIEKIKEGILDGDLQKIADAYNSMTGDNVIPKKSGQDIIERIKFIIDSYLGNKSDVGTFFPETIITESLPKEEQEFSIVKNERGDKVVKAKNDLPVCFGCKKNQVENQYNSLCRECTRLKLAGKQLPTDKISESEQETEE